ncbi:MAG: hypothetical protein HN392_12170 [Anaerolineae bacterium]|jgi:hypothetical protein|nr:hypothetical protein [Anaerolineae bacterium]MBT7074157.1 hypothetical protein [Anaerolineae bacterium]MBT7782735.1 hypothetical protein [Anaerolineae bacterium]
MSSSKPSPPRSFFSLIGWTRDSSILLSIFFSMVGLIVYVWWPLAEEVLSYIDWTGRWWLYIDWLLIGIFFFMSIAIVSHANLSRDSLTILVATFGGLAIESWGTQTNLWHYYTAERPPLWIIPAWPIATLTINRIVRLLNFLTIKKTIAHKEKPFLEKNSAHWLLKIIYWIIFPVFFILMLYFVAPTFDKPYTILSVLLVALLTISPTSYKYAILTFVAGIALGYFLELWGTTRECWTYYTYQKPPLFAVLAHGMAAVAFWRTELLIKSIWLQIKNTSTRKKYERI